MASLVTLAVLGLLLAAAGGLAHRMRLPPILGYLVVGIVASPHALGGDYIPVHLAEEAGHFAVLLILFAIGLELDLKTLTQAVRSSAWVMPFDLVVPIALGALLGMAFGWSVGQSWALGLTLGLSSTLFGERITAARTVPSGVRQRVLGVLISQDVAAAGLLAIMVAIGTGGLGAAGGAGAGVAASGGWAGVGAPLLVMGRLVLALIIMTALLLLVVPRLLDAVARSHVHELLVLLTGSLMLGAAAIGHWAGSAELGALAAGVVAAEAGSRFLLRTALRSLRDVALAAFFVASGFAVDIGVVIGNPLLIIAVAGTFALSKTLVHIPAAVLRGQPFPDAVRTGVALAAMGEFSLVLVAVAEQAGAAHDMLRPVISGALVLLLVTAPLVFSQSDRAARLVDRLPAPTLRLLAWMVEGLRRGMGAPVPSVKKIRRDHLRRLLVNGLLLVAWTVLVAAIDRTAGPLIQNWGVSDIVARGVILALWFVIGVPVLRALWGSYRGLVWSMVGLRANETQGAGRARQAMVNAVLAATVVLLVAPFVLAIPSAWPVLLLAAGLAGGVGIAAWRHINRFHANLADAVGRVLGEQSEDAALLDKIVSRYPWGLRMTTVAVPSDSPVAGRSLEEARLTTRTGATVAVVQRGRQEFVNPSPELVLRPRDALVLMGEPHQLSQAEALVVAHGGALRLEAQSTLAEVVEITAVEGSPWQGRELGELNLKERCGCLVVGVRRAGAQRPTGFDAKLIIKEGDHVILLGTGLQLQRARDDATPTFGSEPEV